jgi:SAM-dependent methyltransferase
VRCDTGDYTAYQSAERAELYDAVYANVGDVAFWEDVAAGSDGGPLLELGCGTGRLLVPLARAGHSVVGLDLASHMLARCREKLGEEPAAVQERVTLVQADMTSFHLGRRFAQIYCPFGSFHHLSTVEEQLACLTACRDHLAPGGTLVLDLINPDPAPGGTSSDTSASAPVIEPIQIAPGADAVEWTEGRKIRSWATVVGGSRSLQVNDCEVTYEILEADGSSRRVTETFPMRFVFRYELEHLLARCGFRIEALYGDYDRSQFTDESLGLIVLASSQGDPAC